MMKTLTKEQITDLLLTAYGFADNYGVVYSCHESLTSLVNDTAFLLQGPNGDERLMFSYDNATFDNGTVAFETPDGDIEAFTVLVVGRELPQNL